MQTCFSDNCICFNTDEVIAFIDIEGHYWDAVEVGIIIYQRHKALRILPIKAAVFHAKPSSTSEFWSGSTYCHGLQKDDLSQIGFQNQDQLRSEVRNFIESYDVKYIIGHDGKNAKQSDNNEFLKFAGIHVEYHNHPIHDWKERCDKDYHVQALEKKFQSQYIRTRGRGRTICPAQHKAIRVGTKGSRETVEAKRKAGYHCSLIDSFELYLYHESLIHPF